MNKELEETIRRLIDINTSADELQMWIYGQPDFAFEIGAEEYADLLNINYASVRGAREARRLLRDFHVGRWPELLERHEVLALCDCVLAGSIPVREGCRRLSEISTRSDLVQGHFWAIEEALDAGANVDKCLDEILIHVTQLRMSLT